MKKIILELNTFMSRDEIHSYLKEKFDFPEYYGKNLDALYDCLTETGRPTAIGLFINDCGPDEADTLWDTECFGGESGGDGLPQDESYLQKVIKTFEDAERCNDNLAVIISR